MTLPVKVILFPDRKRIERDWARALIEKEAREDWAREEADRKARQERKNRQGGVLMVFVGDEQVFGKKEK